MWPKVFAQLLEVLPHVSRLIPMADMFFQSKTASEKANEAALKAMAEGVRSDLGHVTIAHADLTQQFQAQSAQIAEVVTETIRIRTAVEGQLVRTADLEKQLASLGYWIKAAVALLIVAIALLIKHLFPIF